MNRYVLGTKIFTDCKYDEEQSANCAVNQTQARIISSNESDAPIGSGLLKFQVYRASLSGVLLNDHN